MTAHPALDRCLAGQPAEAVMEYALAQRPTSDGYVWQTVEASIADAALESVCAELAEAHAELATKDAEIQRLKKHCDDAVEESNRRTREVEGTYKVQMDLHAEIERLRWMLNQSIADHCPVGGEPRIGEGVDGCPACSAIRDALAEAYANRQPEGGKP